MEDKSSPGIVKCSHKIIARTLLHIHKSKPIYNQMLGNNVIIIKISFKNRSDEDISNC